VVILILEVTLLIKSYSISLPVVGIGSTATDVCRSIIDISLRVQTSPNFCLFQGSALCTCSFVDDVTFHVKCK